MLTESKKSVVTTLPTNVNTEKTQYNTLLRSLQELRDIAWIQALKYRFDPAIGQAHAEYLDVLNGILKECKQ